MSSDSPSALSEVGDHVYLLSMADHSIRFSPTALADLHAGLDAFDAVEGPKALVTTGFGKFYNIGLDLDWLGSDDGRTGAVAFFGELYRLFGRILFNPAPTVAAMNGHAIAAGAMLAAAHDHRVMRSDRGFFSIPEVDLGLPLTEEMTVLLQARLPPHTLHRSVVTGRKWTADELLAEKMVEAIAPEDEVVAKAVAWAASEAHHAGDTLATMKRRLYPTALALLLPEAS